MKTIPGFPDYSITRDGQVWSKLRISPQGHKVGNRWLKQSKKRRGFFNVVLCIAGINFTRTVHRLVLETYIGPRPLNKECRHLNGNPSDNRIENLCWGTHQENMNDRDLHEKTFHPKGEKHPMVKLTNRDVWRIICMYKTGLFIMQEIADLFKVSIASVSNIIKRKSWKHLQV